MSWYSAETRRLTVGRNSVNCDVYVVDNFSALFVRRSSVISSTSQDIVYMLLLMTASLRSTHTVYCAAAASGGRRPKPLGGDCGDPLGAQTPASRPVWARGRCRISPPRFLAECCKRQLNQVSLVLLYFRLSVFF